MSASQHRGAGSEGRGVEKVQAVILAAGKGRRMGGPKALLCWHDGRPLAAVHASILRDEVGIGSVTIVTRAAIAHVLEKLCPDLVTFVSHKRDDWGPGGSIAAAVQAPHLLVQPWTLLLHVDQVPVDPALTISLLGRRANDVDAIRPVFRGRGGHPVVIETEHLRSFFEQDSDTTLRDLMNHPSTRRDDVPVQDPSVRQDLDTPGALHRLTGRLPSFCFDDIAGRQEDVIDS